LYNPSKHFAYEGKEKKGGEERERSSFTEYV